MKRLVSFCLVCLLTLGLLGSLSVSADAHLAVTASATTVTVGQNVVVTLKYDGDGQPIGGVIGSLTFDTNAFSYVSFTGSGVEVNGGAGKMRYVYYASGAEAPTSLTVTFTFKANTPGACTFAVATEEFFNDNDYSSFGAPSGSVTVTASNPTLSGNANLSRLTPSKGTLTPKFSPDVTEYSVTVPYEVSSLTFSAESEHPDAKITISGKSALQVGKTTRVLTVTAPNGDTKKYTLTITRQAAPSTSGTTGTTQPPPPEDALDVAVDGEQMTIQDTQAAVDLPRGFKWSNLTINRVDVPAAVNTETGMVLLYLTSANKANDGFYIYDAANDAFTRYRPFTVAGGTYLLYNLPADKTLSGMVRGSLDYDGGQVTAYLYRDTALSDFCVVWAAPTDGEAGWYTYDKAEGTFQRHHTATIVGDTVTTPSTTSPTKPTEDKTAQVNKGDAVGNFFAENQTVLLIGGGVLLAVILLIVLVIALSSGRGKRTKRKRKH